MTWDGFGWVDAGEPDAPALANVRTVAERHEPLVERTGYDFSLDPGELRLYTSVGFDAGSGRFDVRWTTRGYYSFHYTEDPAFDFRYDRHPHPDAPEKHFHEPPTCPDHEATESPITVETVELVSLAVLQLWGDAVRESDPGLLSQSNPP